MIRKGLTMPPVSAKLLWDDFTPLFLGRKTEILPNHNKVVRDLIMIHDVVDASSLMRRAPILYSFSFYRERNISS